MGVSRQRFYELLKAQPELAAAAITIESKRLWPVVFLDGWLAQHRGKMISTNTVASRQRQ